MENSLVGTELPNGAIIIAITETAHGGVIMARTELQNEYVTWQHQTGRLESTHWGHYFGQDNAACSVDYCHRVSQLMRVASLTTDRTQP